MAAVYCEIVYQGDQSFLMREDDDGEIHIFPLTADEMRQLIEACGRDDR